VVVRSKSVPNRLVCVGRSFVFFSSLEKGKGKPSLFIFSCISSKERKKERKKESSIDLRRQRWMRLMVVGSLRGYGSLAWVVDVCTICFSVSTYCFHTLSCSDYMHNQKRNQKMVVYPNLKLLVVIQKHGKALHHLEVGFVERE